MKISSNLSNQISGGYLTLLFEIDAMFLNDDRHLNNIGLLIAYWRNGLICRTYCTGHHHRSFSQQRLIKAILGKPGFAIDLASISYIGREESITGHGSSPPNIKKTLKLCGFKVFLLPKNRPLQRLNFVPNSEHSRGEKRRTAVCLPVVLLF